MLDTKDKMVEGGFPNPGYNMLDTKDKMVEDGFPNHGYNTDVVALILCCGKSELASGHPRPDETPIFEHFGFRYMAMVSPCFFMG